MKTKLKLHLLCLAILSASAPAHAQDTAFTYQGRLNDNNAPASGNYDLRFAIYDSIGGPTMVAGPLTNSAVAVSNGLFAVTLDFGTGVFSGPARWLDIAVRTNGSGTFSTLNLRQALTPAPYAIFANTASNVVSGSVVKSLNNLKDNVTLAAGSNVTITPSGNTLTIASAGVGGSGIWSVLNNNAYYTAGNVGIGTNGPVSSLHIVSGALASPPRLQSSGTTGFGAGWDFYQGGVGKAYVGVPDSAAVFAPGELLMFGGPGTRVSLWPGGARALTLEANGNVGIGTTTPTAGVRLDIIGTVRVTPGGSGGFLSIAAPNGETGLSVIGVNRADFRFDGSTLKLVAGPGTGPPSSINGIAITTNGNVGIGILTPYRKFEVTGDSRVAGQLAVGRYEPGNLSGPTLAVLTRPGDGAPFVVLDSQNATIFEIITGSPHNLIMHGTAEKSSGGTSWATFSDRRLKQDVQPFAAGLKEVLQLRPVRFRYRDDPKRGLTSAQEEMGFIAQEVREVIPDAVTEDKDGYLSLKADPIHWAAINAIQELNTKLKEQRAENAELKQRLEKLERLMNYNQRGAK